MQDAIPVPYSGGGAGAGVDMLGYQVRKWKTPRRAGMRMQCENDDAADDDDDAPQWHLALW